MMGCGGSKAGATTGESPAKEKADAALEEAKRDLESLREKLAAEEELLVELNKKVNKACRRYVTLMEKIW